MARPTHEQILYRYYDINVDQYVALSALEYINLLEASLAVTTVDLNVAREKIQGEQIKLPVPAQRVFARMV